MDRRRAKRLGVKGPCMAVSEIGERIRTDEAIKHTSYQGQITALCTTIFFCSYPWYPEFFASNYLTNVLEMTKEKLDYTSKPSVAGLPLTLGMAMSRPCTESCNMCLILSELKRPPEAAPLIQSSETKQ